MRRESVPVKGNCSPSENTHFLLVLYGILLKVIRMQNKYLLKKEFYFSLKSFGDSHYVFASTTGGGLLRKPMIQPLNGVVEIPQTHARNL